MHRNAVSQTPLPTLVFEFSRQVNALDAGRAGRLRHLLAQLRHARQKLRLRHEHRRVDCAK